VRTLRARGAEGTGVGLLDAGTDGMAVVFAARGCRTLIIIDAYLSGSDPGAIFEVPGTELE
jgi:hydrogenase maturation protease